MRKLPLTLMVPAVGLLLAVVLMAVVNAASTSAPSAAAEPIDAAAPAPTVVSIADLDAAHAAVRQCLETAGYPVKVILPDAGLRTAQYTFLGVHDITEIHPANDVWSECRAKYLDATSRQWQAQRGTPTTAEREDLHDRLTACVSSGGTEKLMDALIGLGFWKPVTASVAFAVGSGSPTRPMDISRGNLLVYSSCALEMEAETGWQAPPPWPSYMDDLKAGKLPQ